MLPRGSSADSGKALPIRPLLAGAGVFSLEDIVALSMAFEDALLVLHLDRDDPVAAAMAKRIIALAERGDRNSTRLLNAVVSEYEARQR